MVLLEEPSPFRRDYRRAGKTAAYSWHPGLHGAPRYRGVKAAEKGQAGRDGAPQRAEMMSPDLRGWHQWGTRLSYPVRRRLPRGRWRLPWAISV